VVLGRWFGGGSGSGEAEEQKVRADLRRLAQLQQSTDDARPARSASLESLRSIGSFFGGVAKIDGVLRPVIVVATPTEFVLLDAEVETTRPASSAGSRRRTSRGSGSWTRTGATPGGEHRPRPRARHARQERYTVVLDRADGSGTSVSFLFLSGEPALFARNRFRELLGASPDGP
jgi:hypothetical protein